MKKKFAFTIILMLLAASISFFISNILATRNNTLEQNGKWKVSKNNLAWPITDTDSTVGVMGAYQFLSDRQALDKNQLNLGAWHGCQEVIYKYPISPKVVNFKFTLEDKAYLYFIFNKTADQFSAFRFSKNPIFPSVYVEALDSGEFTKLVNLDTDNAFRQNTNKVRVDFKDPNKIILHLNDKQLTAIETKLQTNFLVGFRGSYQPAIVDDISFALPNKIIKDSFYNYQHFFRNFLVLFVLFFVLPVFLLLRIKKSGRQKLFPFLILEFAFLLVVIVVHYFFVNQSFPIKFNSLLKQKTIQTEESNWLERRVEQMVPAIESNLQQNNGQQKKIFILGSSQTEGVGASAEKKSLAKILEFELNSKTYESWMVINTAISGTSSKNIKQMYFDHWIKYQPNLVIINLSHNDQEYQVGFTNFENNIRQIVEKNSSENIYTVLVKEAVNPEKYPEGLRYHQAFDDFSSNQLVTVIDAHQYLLSKINSGIIWWDFIHPTDYGHQLLGKILAKELIKTSFIKEAPNNQLN